MTQPDSFVTRSRPILTVLSVIGTRPEAIKMAPVIRQLQRYPARVRSRICVTAQHRDMLDQVLTLFGIRPDYDLDIMRRGQTPSKVSAAILRALEPILAAERPDWVLVQGDTTTAASAALAAFYSHTRIGHVEAGLRTSDKWQPFPEEAHRRIVGCLADLHFAPTERARLNLLGENVAAKNIVVTGNPVVDALRWAISRPLLHQVIESYPAALTALLDKSSKSRLILITAHRRENFGAPLTQICLAVRDVARRYGDRVQFLFPIHPNPQVQSCVRRLLAGLPNVLLFPPLDYHTIIHVLRRAYFVVTDSGGLQEEGPSLGRPVLVMRTVTERPEGVQAGGVRLIGTRRDVILAECARLLDDPVAYRAMAAQRNSYGDGQAAKRIVRSILNHDRHRTDVLPPDRSPD